MEDEEKKVYEVHYSCGVINIDGKWKRIYSDGNKNYTFEDEEELNK